MGIVISITASEQDSDMPTEGLAQMFSLKCLTRFTIMVKGQFELNQPSHVLIIIWLQYMF